MSLVAAKCTQCGAGVEADNTKGTGICKYCGTAFITEAAERLVIAKIRNKRVLSIISVALIIAFGLGIFAVARPRYSYKAVEGGYQIKRAGIKNFSGDVVIPAEHKGKPVVSIGNRGFQRCENVNSFIIPDTVTSHNSARAYL